MSNANTDEMNGKRPFEERVFARFDALDAAMRVTDSRLEKLEFRLGNVESRLGNVESRLGNVESRLQKLEIRAYDTKPICEQALKEIVDTRRELSTRLDRIEGILLETRAGLRDAEDRIDKLERKLTQ